jgi:hypothetical protein
MEKKDFCFEYEQGDVINALFENDVLDKTTFKDRMDSDYKISDNQIFRKMHKCIADLKENKTKN